MTTEQAKIDLVNLIFADRNEKDMEMYIEHGARYILYSSDTGIFAKALKNSVTLFDPFRTTKR